MFVCMYVWFCIDNSWLSKINVTNELENSPKKIRARWKTFFYNAMETELARAVDVMMTKAKRIYILMIKVNKLFSFFSSLCFLKEIENMLSVFLSRYRNSSESFGELEKAVETLAYGLCLHSISRSPKLLLVSIKQIMSARFLSSTITRRNWGRII